MAADWSSITAERKRAIRAEMLTRWKQKLRKKGASKAAGGDPTKAGGTGSMKGFGLTAKEIQYAQTVRKTQRKKGAADASYVIPGTKKSRKDIAKTARKTGASNPNLVTAQKMKSVSKGGTVSKGSHAGDAGKKEAAAWRRKHRTAAVGDAGKLAKIERRYRHMRGLKPK